jgi:Holliday junction resolvase RusA-like endonuclease
MVIKFEVPCIPVAQPRQRHSVVNGHVRNYIPKTDPVWVFKTALQLAASTVRPETIISGPIRIILDFIFPRTKSMIWKNKPMVRVAKSTKPDIDNLCKSVFDALNGILFVDDSQICECHASKYIASGNEQPRVIITIEEM